MLKKEAADMEVAALVEEMTHSQLLGLEDSGLTAYLKDALTLILENRPESPVQFIAEYFRAVVHGSSPVARAYKFLRLCPRDRESFLDNLVAAYTLLDSRSGTAGLTGAEHLKLLRMLCADFPEDIVDLLMEIIASGDSDLVTFPDFLGGVRACLLFEEFLHEAEDLFRETTAFQGASGGAGAEGGAGGGAPKVRKSVLKGLLKEVVDRAKPGADARPTSPSTFDRTCQLVLASEDLMEEVTFHEFVRVLFRVIARQEQLTRSL